MCIWRRRTQQSFRLLPATHGTSESEKCESQRMTATFWTAHPKQVAARKEQRCTFPCCKPLHPTFMLGDCARQLREGGSNCTALQTHLKISGRRSQDCRLRFWGLCQARKQQLESSPVTLHFTFSCFSSVGLVATPRKASESHLVSEPSCPVPGGCRPSYRAISGAGLSWFAGFSLPRLPQPPEACAFERSLLVGMALWVLETPAQDDLSDRGLAGGFGAQPAPHSQVDPVTPTPKLPQRNVTVG